jgi:hypothetical protein
MLDSPGSKPAQHVRRTQENNAKCYRAATVVVSERSATIASGAGRYGDNRAVADAIKSIRPALDNFYASLNDEQKARFNMMAGPLHQRG